MVVVEDRKLLISVGYLAYILNSCDNSNIFPLAFSKKIITISRKQWHADASFPLLLYWLLVAPGQY